ncbi:hypothetical protein WR25_05739 [Diploscapter pachys]|uniref:Pre-rRNA-processing protein TSR2 homolog n=1 Tax=Diploscapter pachys TaxID=2018661 RepID=A0A2A2JKK6_9BILA|nr:hypothetical protein WR25_05739 [Diploscapter pachys]
MTSVNEQEWKGVVQRVLEVWSGYQLALEHASGGDDTRQKHEWLVDVLSEHVLVTRGLKNDDLETWLSSILYEDFNLVLEDDSVYQTACFLLEAFGYMKNKDVARLQQLLNSLPSKETVELAKRQSQAEMQGDSDEEMDGMEGIEEDDQDSDEDIEDGNEESESRSTRQRQPRTTTDEDGWTTVHRR